MQHITRTQVTQMQTYAEQGKTAVEIAQLYDLPVKRVHGFCPGIDDNLADPEIQVDTELTGDTDAAHENWED